MAGGGSVVITGPNKRSTLDGARVENGRLLVSGTGGGAGGDVNIAEVGGNPVGATVPVSGPIEVEQGAHDDLNANANMQVGNADVSGGNPVPTTVGNFPATQTVDGTVTDNAQVTEDDAVPATPDLLPVAAERADSPSTLTEADGDWGHLRMDSRGALWVRTLSAIQKLSASVDGKPVVIAGTNFAGRTTVHTAPATGLDKVFMVARNFGLTDQVLTIYWGDTAADSVSVLIPSTDSRVIAIGEVVQNSIIISMSSQNANFVKITGHIERFP